MDRWPVLARFVRWLALLGASDDDSDETRAQKVALTLAASLITALAVIWVGTYAALGGRPSLMPRTTTQLRELGGSRPHAKVAG